MYEGLEEGSVVTLWDQRYIISRCDSKPRYKVCSFCQWVNKMPPCVMRANYPNKEGFSVVDCLKYMPEGMFPKKLQPKGEIG